jgi:RimJ/RimL family protein N-acetyltransferase
LRDHAELKHGLIADLSINPTYAKESIDLSQALITHAEAHLAKQSVTKIDAIVLDGYKLTEPFLKAGYWASRKTVTLEWDLTSLEAFEPQNEVEITLMDTFDIEEVTDFILNSYQPYYQWWKDDREDRLWERIDYPAADPDEVEKKNLAANRERIVAMLQEFNQNTPQRWVMARQNGKLVALCDIKISEDENFDWGILITRNHPGKGVARHMLFTALHWLKSQGAKKALVTTTSGMDDFDPTVYLYTLSGATILGEFLNCVKRCIIK